MSMARLATGVILALSACSVEAPEKSRFAWTDDMPEPKPGATCTSNAPCYEKVGSFSATGVCVTKPVACPAATTPCAKMVCDPGQNKCIATPLEGASCADDNPCTVDEHCEGTACVSNDDPCDDKEPCTEDNCNPKTGCVHAPASSNPLPDCDDGDPCTEKDACVGKECKGVKFDCDDGNECTDDSCTMEKGCLHTSNVAPCQKDDECFSHACADGNCVAGAPKLDCDDKNPCTEDTCEAGKEGGCKHFAGKSGKPCDDGNSCTSGDVCQYGYYCEGQPRLGSVTLGGKESDSVAGLWRIGTDQILVAGNIFNKNVSVAMAAQDVLKVDSETGIPLIEKKLQDALPATFLPQDVTVSSSGTVLALGSFCTPSGNGGSDAGSAGDGYDAGASDGSAATSCNWLDQKGIAVLGADIVPTGPPGEITKAYLDAFQFAGWQDGNAVVVDVEDDLSGSCSGGEYRLMVRSYDQAGKPLASTTVAAHCVSISLRSVAMSSGGLAIHYAVSSGNSDTYSVALASGPVGSAKWALTDLQPVSKLLSLWSARLAWSPTNGHLVAISSEGDRWLDFAVNANNELDFVGQFNVVLGGVSLAMPLVWDGSAGFAALTDVDYSEGAPYLRHFDASYRADRNRLLVNAAGVEPAMMLRDGPSDWLWIGSVKKPGLKSQWFVSRINDWGTSECSVDDKCQATPAAACEDGDACTVTDCDPATGKCSASAPIEVKCGSFYDNSYNSMASCLPGDAASCTPAGYCYLTYPACQDGNPCTLDDCKPSGCDHVPKDCSDPNPCTLDACKPVVAQGNPAGECTHEAAPASTPCDDGDPCTAVGTCQAGSCEKGATGNEVCAFGNSCMTETGCPSGCNNFDYASPACSSCKPGHWLPDCRASMAAGLNHTCLVESDGSLVCWGDNKADQLASEAGQFKRVAAADNTTCAIRGNGSIGCWGTGLGSKPTPTDADFVELGIAPNFGCAIHKNGKLACWGDGSATATASAVLGAAVPALSADRVGCAGDACCARSSATHTLSCWGKGAAGLAKAPTETVIDYDMASPGVACALIKVSSGPGAWTTAVKCWGSDKTGVVTGAPTEEGFVALDVGPSAACAARNDGTLNCWGDVFGEGAELTVPVTAGWRVLALGKFHVCGVRDAGSPVCFGADFVATGTSEAPKALSCGNGQCQGLESATSCAKDCELPNPCDLVCGSSFAMSTGATCYCDALCLQYGDCCQPGGKTKGGYCKGSSCEVCK